MLLTLAVLQPIIGVVPEQKSCTRNQKQKTLKNSTIKTSTTRRCLFFIDQVPSCQQNNPLHAGHMHTVWWSCRVLPPGPKGNLSFVYAHSAVQVLTTAGSKEQNKDNPLASRKKLKYRIVAAAIRTAPTDITRPTTRRLAVQRGFGA